MSKETSIKPNTLYTGIAVVVAIAAAGYVFFTSLTGAQSSTMTQEQNAAQQDAAQAQTPAASQAGALPTPPADKVLVQDVVVGSSTPATKGATIAVEYVGKLQNGTIFDQSSAHGGTFSFVFGAGQVIPGWEQGIAGMKVGGERILIIPPALAYGDRQVGPIPPNSTLIFDVKLVSVSGGAATSTAASAAAR